VLLPAEVVHGSLATLMLAVATGLVTTVAATAVPAWRVLSQPAAPFLHLAPNTIRAGGSVGRALVGAVIGLALVAALVILAPRTLPYRPLVAYIMTVICVVMVSCGFFSPPAASLLGRLASAVAARGSGTSLLLAAGSVARNPAAPAAVVAAIIMGFGAVLADASLTASFKGTWLRWLDEQYQSDLFVTGAPSAVSLLTEPPVAEAVVDELRAVPRVREAQGVRIVEVPFAGRPVTIQAIDRTAHGLTLLDGAWERAADEFWQGDGVALSDNLAHRTGLHRGDRIRLPSPDGEQDFPVLGVFEDFQGGGDLGSIAMSRSRYRSTWRDHSVSRIRVWTDTPADVDRVRTEIQRRVGASYGLRALTAGEFRRGVEDLVENAFAMTYALVLIALVISFVGVINFLFAAVLDRRPELRTLEAVGVPPGQIAGAIVVEGGLVGAVGVLVGLAAGTIVSRIIVLHSVPMVNGWHFAYVFPVETAIGMSVGVVLIAAAAGLAPARLATRRSFVVEGPSE
jgi:putative ABC transport system permease protein